MDETRTCPACNETIPPDAPGGACPHCLIGVGLTSGSGASGGGGAVPDVAIDDVQRRFPAYEVLGTLGRGGMGVVFRAKQRALDREVALKVLPAGPSRPAGFVERFEREAKALARLQHPGIVQVFDFGTSPDGWCYLAMEFVDGTNLRRALAGGRLAPKDALAIVPQICDALQYAHDQGVVHRDIKPENVLLAKDGRVKIADFGLAKLVADASGSADGSWITRTGHSMGTPLYMAPEQIEHPADVDHRADIYSLGVVFYEMLTGELPLGRFAAPSKKTDVDARIDEIVLRTLEKEREARFQRAGDVRTEMDAAAAGEPSRVVVGSHEFRPARPGQAALGVLLLLAGVVTYFVAAVVTHHDWWSALWVAAAGAVVFVTSGFRRFEAPGEGRPAARSAATDDAPPSRLSRLAVASLFAPIAVVATVYLVWWMNRGAADVTLLSVLRTWASVASFAGVATSIVAITRILASRGRIRGVALAVIGAAMSTFAGAQSYDEVRGRMVTENLARRVSRSPRVALMPDGSRLAVSSSGAFFTPDDATGVGDTAPDGWPRPLTPKPKPPDTPARVVDGVEIAPGIPETMVAETVHGPEIRALVGLAQALWPPKSHDELSKLYAPGDVTLIEGLDEASRALRTGDGALGLPLVSEAFVGGSLRTLRITKVTVDWGRTRGWVTLAGPPYENRSFVVDVVRATSGDLTQSPWHFALAPVRIATAVDAAEDPSVPMDARGEKR